MRSCRVEREVCLSSDQRLDWRLNDGQRTIWFSGSGAISMLSSKLGYHEFFFWKKNEYNVGQESNNMVIHGISPQCPMPCHFHTSKIWMDQ